MVASGAVQLRIHTSMALVTGMIMKVPSDPPLEMSDFRRMVRPSGTGAPGARQVRAGRCIR